MATTDTPTWQLLRTNVTDGRRKLHTARRGDVVITVRLDPGVTPTDAHFDEALALAAARWKAKVGR